MITSHLEKLVLSLSSKIENVSNSWSEEEIQILKKFFLEKHKEKAEFLFENGKPRIFVIENDRDFKTLREALEHFLNNAESISERERFIYLLFVSKLRFIKFKEKIPEEYIEDILNLFSDEVLKKISHSILKMKHYLGRKENVTENLIDKLDRKYQSLLKIFHTFYVDVNFSNLCTLEKEHLDRYLKGFTIPDKYHDKFRKEWEKANKIWKEDETYLKNVELQEKKLLDDLKESVNIEIGDFSKELRNLLSKDKFNLLLPYIKEKTAKWLRSFGIILRDYESLQKVKRDYEDRLKRSIFKDKFSPLLPSPDVLIKEWEEAKTLLLKGDAKITKILEQVFFEYYMQKKKEGTDFVFLENFVKKGFLSAQLDIDTFEKELSYFIDEIFIPHVTGSYLINQVYIIPDEMDQGKEKDLSYWITFKKLPKGEYYIAGDMENLRIEFPLKIDKEDFISRFKEIVCVLVYDIRGSTFMSLRLKDPVKELSIKNQFSKEILRVVKKYGGFPLKDLGDGGIILFSGNSKEIFEEVFEEAFLPKGRTLRIPKLFEKEVKVLPAEDTATRAILCARDMYQRSFEFIRDKYSKYRDWFPDVVENYPPLKALFRLGIGIAGGRPGKHIHIDYNSFGDIDASGSIINVANLLAQGKNPLTSLIYIDSTTFFSFLINSSEWDIECEEESIFDRVRFYLNNFDDFWVYDFPLREIKVKIRGTDLLDQPEKEKGLLLQVPDELEIGDDDEFIVKNHPVKLVYEVEPYERKS